MQDAGCRMQDAGCRMQDEERKENENNKADRAVKGRGTAWFFLAPFPFSLLSALLIGFWANTGPAIAQNAPTDEVAQVAIVSKPSSGKSKWKAAGLSLLIPGLGQAYAGSGTRARVFLIGEGMAWASFAAFRVYGSWRATDYRVFAAEHAGVTLNGQPDVFFRDIGAFSGSDAYNFVQQLSQGAGARTYTGLNTWAWDTDASRKGYLTLRRSSRRAQARSVYVVGFALMNRLISAIDASKVAGRASGEPSSSFNLYLPPDGSVWLMAGMTF